jgi:hypothetical protein
MRTFRLDDENLTRYVADRGDVLAVTPGTIVSG